MNNTSKPAVIKDDIRSASDSELLRMYRFTLLRNRKGRLDKRLMRIITEIRQRYSHMFQGQTER